MEIDKNKIEEKTTEIIKDVAKETSKEVVKTGVRTLLIPIALVIAALVIVSLFAFPKFGLFHGKELSIEKTVNVVEEIKKIGEFTTACYYEEMALRDVRVDTIESSGILGIGAGQKNIENEIILIGKGCVRAGFDLSNIGQDGINIHGDTLELILSEVKIFETVMNPSDFITEYEKGEWSHERTISLKTNAKKQLERNAIESGILDKAEKNGIKRLESLFATFGFHTILLSIN